MVPPLVWSPLPTYSSPVTIFKGIGKASGVFFLLQTNYDNWLASVSYKCCFHFGVKYYSLNLNSMSTPMKAYDLLCSRFHIPWVWKRIRQSETGVRWKIDGTISENHHDVSHLISVRSECVRLYLLSILNNPSVPPSHIKQLQKVKKKFFWQMFYKAGWIHALPQGQK